MIVLFCSIYRGRCEVILSCEQRDTEYLFVFCAGYRPPAGSEDAADGNATTPRTIFGRFARHAGMVVLNGWPERGLYLRMNQLILNGEQAFHPVNRLQELKARQQ